MAAQVHVYGEAQLQVQTSGTVFTLLGVSVDGVSIEFRDFTEPVFTDTFGPDVPFDEQQMLQDAIIRAQLVWYDATVYSNIRSRPAVVNSGTAGTLGFAGELWGAGAMYFPLLVYPKVGAASLNGYDNDPYNFPKARLLDAQPMKVGTRRTLLDVTFRALPYTGTAGSTLGAVLWSNSTTGHA